MRYFLRDIAVLVPGLGSLYSYLFCDAPVTLMTFVIVFSFISSIGPKLTFTAHHSVNGSATVDGVAKNQR